MSNEQLRKYVNLIDNGPKKRKQSINESAGARIKYKRVQALTEAQRLVQLIENSEFTEEQLNELLGGVSAVAGAAGRAIGGGATKVGQGLQRAGSTLAKGAQGTIDAAGRAVQGAGSAVKTAATQMGQKVGDIYQQGEQAAAAKRAEQEQQRNLAKITSSVEQFKRSIKPEDLPMVIQLLQGEKSPTTESRRHRRR